MFTRRPDLKEVNDKILFLINQISPQVIRTSISPHEYFAKLKIVDADNNKAEYDITYNQIVEKQKYTYEEQRAMLALGWEKLKHIVTSEEFTHNMKFDEFYLHIYSYNKSIPTLRWRRLYEEIYGEKFCEICGHLLPE